MFSFFQHIYHTVGIEGNRMSLSETRSILETRMAIGGRSIAEHNEIIGLEAALKYINATLINRLGSISVDDILEIHKRVMGFVDPLESGVFRQTQVCIIIVLVFYEFVLFIFIGVNFLRYLLVVMFLQVHLTL